MSNVGMRLSRLPGYIQLVPRQTPPTRKNRELRCDGDIWPKNQFSGGSSGGTASDSGPTAFWKRSTASAARSGAPKRAMW